MSKKTIANHTQLSTDTKTSIHSRKLLRNTIIISIGKICTSAITFLLLPLYTGILSTDEYGIVDLLNTLTTLSLPVIGLQIDNGVFRELIEVRKNKTSEQTIITTGFLSLLLQCLIPTVLFFIVAPFIHNNYQYFLLINVLAYIFVSFLQQVARGLGNTTKYATSSFINAVTTIFFNIVFLIVFKLNAYGMLLGTFCGFLSTIIYLLRSLHFTSYVQARNFSKPMLKALFRYSIPLIPNALTWWIIFASDRIIVASILGLNDNGILAAALKFSTIITTLYNIIDISWTESLSSAIKDIDIGQYFNRMTNIIIKLFTSLGLSIIAFMPIIFPILINSNFSEAYPLIPISIISAILCVIQGLVAAIYIAKRNTKTIAYASLVTAVINIFVHISFINIIGLYASVISTFIALSVFTAYCIYNVNKEYFRIKIDKQFILLAVASSSFILIAYYLNNIYANILSITLSIMVAILFNKKSFFYIKNIVTKRIFHKEKGKKT